MNLTIKDVFIEFSIEQSGISYNFFVEFSKDIKYRIFNAVGLSLKDVEIVKEICGNISKAILYKKDEKHAVLCKFIIENFQGKKIKIKNEDEVLIPNTPITWTYKDENDFKYKWTTGGTINLNTNPPSNNYFTLTNSTSSLEDLKKLLDQTNKI